MFVPHNSDIVSVHVTSACNKRCIHCYQDNYTREIDLAKVYKVLDTLKFSNISIYGGEPLLRISVIQQIIDKYPDSNFYVHINGTIPAWDILDKVTGIYLTVESFFYNKQPPFRFFSKKSFYTLMQTLDRYEDKICVTHNVYPYGNDINFMKMARLRNLCVDICPIIIPGTTWDIDEESFYSMNVFPPNVKPKLRILENGIITRDLRGIYNGDKELPIHKKCLNCICIDKCPFVSMFPHMCYDILNDMKDITPWFCDCTQTYTT